jgi:hypothetical protein
VREVLEALQRGSLALALAAAEEEEGLETVP